MQKKLYAPGILLILFLAFSQVVGQQSDTTHNGIDAGFSSMLNMSRELSYVTFSQGLGDIEPLLFEAKVSPSFFIAHKESWAIELKMTILLRLLNKKSFPIRTPSYMPGLSFHKRISKWQTSIGESLFYDNAFWTVSYRHHSNGQEDYFYNEDFTTINVNSGNFSANYLEFGITSFDFESRNGEKKFKSIRMHLEHHPSWPIKWYLEDLEHTYGLTRLFFTYSTFNLTKLTDQPTFNNKFFKRSRVKLKAGWIFGSMFGVSEFDISERAIVEGTYIYHPKKLDDVALFLQVYHGQDYYNIHFENVVNILRIGLISDPLDFMNVKEIFK